MPICSVRASDGLGAVAAVGNLEAADAGVLPGIHNEHKAVIHGEHDRGLTVPVMLLGLSAWCS
jgi:hypothetical protein